MENKAQVSQVVVMILVLMGAIVIFLYIDKFTGQNELEQSINRCRASVILQAASTVEPGITGKTSPLQLDCGKRYVNFYNTRVEIGLSPDSTKPVSINYGGKQVNQFSKLNDFVVNQVLAEEMRVCKFEFLDGQKDIFPNENNNAFSNQNVCFICSEVSFQDSVSTNSFYGLVQYTNTTTIKNEDMTYYQYLTQQSVFENTVWAQPDYKPGTDLSIGSFDKNKRYVVFFERIAVSYVGKINIFFPPGMSRAMWVAIAPEDSINNYCDVQAI